MGKLRTMFFALAITLAMALPAYSAEIKIGYANLQKALNECEAGIKAKETLQTEADKLEAELDQKQEDLKKMKDEIDKKAGVWNKETRDAKEKEFRGKSQDFQKLYMEYGEELNKKKQQTENEIISDLKVVLEDIAKKKNYTFIFEKSAGGILYGPEDADLTNEVIKAYNKKFKEKK